MLMRYIIAEALKLRRSLALLLCLAAPTCVAIMMTLIALEREAPAKLDMMGISAAAMWAFGMLPLAVTALSVLMTQMEHGPRTWDHLLTLPGARPRIYLAKALLMIALIAGMQLLLFLEILIAVPLVESLRSTTGALDAGALAVTLAKMGVAAMLACMIQLWVALRFRSFVPPLVLGIGGTFVAIAATSARQGVYFPWLMSVNVLAANPDEQALAMVLGGFGGLVALFLMLIHLSRHEVAA